MTATTSQRQDSRVRDIMTRDAECIAEAASVTSAAERLAETGVGALPVCDGQDRVVGMITDRDIVVRVVAQGADPARARVADFADGEPVTLEEDATLGHARTLMRHHGVRRLPVVRARRLVGIVGHADLIESDDANALVATEREIAREPADHRSAAWLHARGYHNAGADGDQATRDGRERRASDAAITDHVQDLLADRD